MLTFKYMDAFCYMRALSAQLKAFLLIFKHNVHMDIVVTRHFTLPVAVAGRENAAS